MIKLLIADDHIYLAEGVQAAMEDYDVELVGKVRSLAELENEISNSKPDILLLDIMFGGNETGITFAKKYTQVHGKNAPKIIVFSQYDDAKVVKSAFEAGVSSFLSKNSSPEELYTAISEVHKGEIYLPQDIAQKLAISVVTRSGVQETDPRKILTARELSIFCEVARGYTQQEIATSMNLALRTIAGDISKCKNKLGVDRSADFTRLALKWRMID